MGREALVGRVGRRGGASSVQGGPAASPGARRPARATGALAWSWAAFLAVVLGGVMLAQAPGVFSDLDVDGDLFIELDDQILARHLNTVTGTSTGTGLRSVAVQPLSWWPTLTGDPICAVVGGPNSDWLIGSNPANQFGRFGLPAGLSALGAAGVTAVGSNLWVADGAGDAVFRVPQTDPSSGIEFNTPAGGGGSDPMRGIASDTTYLYLFEDDSYWRVTQADPTTGTEFNIPTTSARGGVVSGSNLWVVDGASPATVWRIPLGASIQEFELPSGVSDPRGITASGSNLWVVDNTAPESVWRVPISDPTTGTELSLPTNVATPEGITAVGLNLWVLDSGGMESVWVVSQSDPSTGTEMSLLPSIAANSGITAIGSNIWYVENAGQDTVRIVPQSDPDGTAMQFNIPSASAQGVAAEGTDLLIADSTAGYWRVAQADPTTGALEGYPSGFGAAMGITVSGDDIWILDTTGNDSVWRIPADTGTEFNLPSGIQPAGIALSGSNLWIVDVNSGADTVWRVSQSDTSAGTEFSLPPGFALSPMPAVSGVTASGSDLWISTSADKSVWRVPQANPGATACGAGGTTTTLTWTYATSSDNPAIRVRRTAGGEVVEIWHQEDPPAAGMPISIPFWETTTDTLAAPPVPSLALLGSLYADAPSSVRQDALTELRAYVVGRGWLGTLNAVSDLSGVPASCPAAPGGSCEPMARYVALRELAAAGGELIYDLVRRELRVSEAGEWSATP